MAELSFDLAFIHPSWINYVVYLDISYMGICFLSYRSPQKQKRFNIRIQKMQYYLKQLILSYI